MERSGPAGARAAAVRLLPGPAPPRGACTATGPIARASARRCARPTSRSASGRSPIADLRAARAGRRCAPGTDGAPPRLPVNFFGLLGPNGPLPLHLTEYARDRLRNADDPTMTRFLDVFHHRMLLLFYRAWAAGQPTVSHDRPGDRPVRRLRRRADRARACRRCANATPSPTRPSCFYAGRLSAHRPTTPRGWRAMVGDFFGMPARVEPFVGDWLDLPAAHRWRLGAPARLRPAGAVDHRWARASGAASRSSAWCSGRSTRAQFQRMLPGGASLPKLAALVRNYVGDELRWDLRLILEEQIDEPLAPRAARASAGPPGSAARRAGAAARRSGAGSAGREARATAAA